MKTRVEHGSLIDSLFRIMSHRKEIRKAFNEKEKQEDELKLAEGLGEAKAITDTIVELDTHGAIACQKLTEKLQKSIAYSKIIDTPAEIEDVDDVDGFGAFTPLFFAVTHQDLLMIDLLIAAKADVDKYCRTKTPLTLACNANQPKIVKRLLKAKADPNKPTLKGTTSSTPLNYACLAQSNEMVELLLAAKANPNTANTKSKRTPLMLAASRDSYKICHTLLKAGADPNVSGKGYFDPVSSRYPLTEAIAVDSSAILNLLADAKADLTIQSHSSSEDHNHETMLDLAIFVVHQDVIACLMEHKIPMTRSNELYEFIMGADQRYALIATFFCLFLQYIEDKKTNLIPEQILTIKSYAPKFFAVRQQFSIPHEVLDDVLRLPTEINKLINSYDVPLDRLDFNLFQHDHNKVVTVGDIEEYWKNATLNSLLKHSDQDLEDKLFGKEVKSPSYHSP